MQSLEKQISKSMVFDKKIKTKKYSQDVTIITGEQELLSLRLFQRIANKCSLDEISLLINKLEDINVFRESDGTTALHLAVSNNDKQLCKLLIDNGANVNIYTFVRKGKETPLYLASMPSVDIDILELLLENGANVTLKSTSQGITALHNVLDMQDIFKPDIWEAQYDKLKLLVKWKADVNTLTDDNLNSVEVLFHTNSDHNPFIVKALNIIISSGFNVNRKGKIGRSPHLSNLMGVCPLQLAVVLHPSCMELLIQKGADLSENNLMFGKTIMTSLVGYDNIDDEVRREKIFEYVNMLVNYGISINSVTICGESVLHKALSSSLEYHLRSSIPLEEFLSLGVDVNLQNIFGETALMSLSESRDGCNSEAWKYIVKQTDVNVQDYNGLSLLMRVMRFGNPGIVRTLMIHKAQVNDVDKCGRTAFHHLILARRFERDGAKEFHYKEISCGQNKKIIYEEVMEIEQKLFIIQILVNNKAQCEVKDKFNKNAFQYLEEDDEITCLSDETLTNRISKIIGKPVPDRNVNKVLDLFQNMKWRLTIQWHTWNCIDYVINLDANFLADLLSTPGIGIVNCISEFKTVQLHVDKAMNNLAAKMHSEYLHFSVQLSGSVSEGTKVGFPDEFDYLLFIEGLNNIFHVSEADEKPGFVTMRIKDKEIFPDFCKDFVDDEGYVFGDMFSRYLFNIVCKALQDGKVFLDTDLYYHGRCFSDPNKAIFLFKLIFPTESFNDIELTIDFVPVIKLSNNWWPCCAIEKSNKLLVERSSSFCFVLTKNRDHTNFRISSSLLETEIINSLPEYMRKAYMLLKILNHYFHFHLPSLDTCNSPLVNSSISEKDRILIGDHMLQKGLKSYHLKTILFHVACMELEEGSTVPHNKNEIENIVKFAIRVLEQFTLCIENQFLSNFFFPNVSLFPSSIYEDNVKSFLEKKEKEKLNDEYECD